MSEVKVPTVKLEGKFSTNYLGIERIMRFYDRLSMFRDTEVNIDCYGLKWLDGNLTALMNALEHRLSKSNNIELRTDFDFLSENFDVLFRNGWLRDKDYELEDVQQTTIPCTHFLPHQIEDFYKYVCDRLMQHRGMPAMVHSLRSRIQNDLAEIYGNVYRHAKTEEPVFVCGQYFPKMKLFQFTMVDIGVGFLEPIRRFTNHSVVSDIDAIHWAINGNSTSGEDLAGMGLQSVREYCQGKRDIFQIYSGHAYWGTDMGNESDQSHKRMNFALNGSLLNLKFHCK